MKKLFEIKEFFKEKFRFKPDFKGINSNSRNKNTKTRIISKQDEDVLIFGYSSKREELEISYPVHFISLNSPNNTSFNNNRLVPFLDSCTLSIIDTDDASSEDFNSFDSIDIGDDVKLFDKKALKRIMDPLNIIEEIFSKPRRTPRGNMNNEKLFIVKIPFDFINNSILNYCSKSLTELIPSAFLGLKGLSTLQLCCNSLRELPEEICLLKRLETLSLSNNKLKWLPSTIGYLTNLENLYLDRNELKTLPRSISGLKKLKVLSLAANEFIEIPRHVMLLNRLITLECDRNPNLIGVPSEITKFSQLGRFHVEDCPKLLKESEYRQFEEENCIKGTPSLLECSSRSMIRNRRPVINSIPRHLKLFLSRSEECSFCSGPMINSRSVHCRTIKRIDRTFPVIEHLCSSHWKSEDERIKKIFSSSPQTTPPNLIGADRRNRIGPLAPFNQFEPEKLEKGKRILSKFDQEDLGRLLVPLSLIVDWPKYTRNEMNN